ncbi:hypothetical protein [Kitasatospora sp. NPDC087314]|uniref:hypothetical protein n=1 Tax=Kitasatospora sp. NPDC087314 TaxID=3364068 RepID=UPI0037F4E13F
MLDIGVRQGSAGIATVEGFDVPGAPLTLQRQEAAEFKLLWHNTAAAGDRAPDDGRYLDIAPQSGRPRLAVPARLDLGATGGLGISAWAEPAPGRPGRSAATVRRRPRAGRCAWCACESCGNSTTRRRPRTVAGRSGSPCASPI